MKQILILVPIALLAACNSQSSSEADPTTAGGSATTTPAPAQAGQALPPEQPAVWDLAASGEGTALLFPATGDAVIRLFCPAGKNEILVNIPGFRPIGSEERMSFGSGGNVEALVADTRGDSQRGGVSGTGAVPSNLGELIGGPVAVNYGAQNSGPHPAPPPELVSAFIAACG